MPAGSVTTSWILLKGAIALWALMAVGLNLFLLKESKEVVARYALCHDGQMPTAMDGHGDPLIDGSATTVDDEHSAEEKDAEASVVILTDNTLRIACFTGAFVGALVSTIILYLISIGEIASGQSPPLRQSLTTMFLLLNFVGSGAASVLLSPVACRSLVWMVGRQVPLDYDSVLAISGAVAFLSIGVLKPLKPFVEGWIVNKAKKRVDSQIEQGPKT